MTYTPTGWRRLIGSPKLQIIFHKRAIKYRSLLRKMTCKDKGSQESSPPCTANEHFPIPTYAVCCAKELIGWMICIGYLYYKLMTH